MSTKHDARVLERATAILALGFLIVPPARGAGGWPSRTGAPESFTAPAIGDVDGNGVLDLAFGSWDGHLYCVDAAGTLRWKVDLSDDFLTPQLVSSPTLADADGDASTLEVFVGSGVGSLWGRLYVIGSNGVERARFDVNSEVLSSPLVLDTDFDGAIEVYFGESLSPLS